MTFDPERFVEFLNESEIRATVLAVFDALHAELRALLPDAAIEHVGSTAIPGAVTKGDLDVCVLVEQGAFREADRILADHFPRNTGSDQTASFSAFSDESRRLPVGVQLAARGGPEDSFVRWRELLRGSPQLLSAYNDLKRRWHGRSHEDYRAAKAHFIEQGLESAERHERGISKDGAAGSSPRKVVGVCPACGALVDATHLAFAYLEKLGAWDGIEDCWECGTALSISVQLDSEGKARVRCERL